MYTNMYGNGCQLSQRQTQKAFRGGRVELSLEEWIIEVGHREIGVPASLNCTVAFLLVLCFECFVTLTLEHFFSPLNLWNFLGVLTEEITMVFLLDCLQQEMLIRKFSKFFLYPYYDLKYVFELKSLWF